MYSGQSDSNHSQTDTPNIHRINVMENTETKETGDGLGHYENVKRGEGADGGVDGQKKGKNTENVTDKGTDKDTDKGTDKDKITPGQKVEAKKDTVVIVDPTTLNSSKGDCWTRFQKFCLENKCVVALVCILIFFVLLFLGLYIDSRSKADKEPMTPPTPGVTTKTATTKTASPGTTEPPVPMAVVQGIITTANNYTAALADPTSLAYKSFENSFKAAVISFYQPSEYIGYYDETVVTMFEASGLQCVVHFEILFSQLDNDDVLPDAHTVLLDQLQDQQQLGTFLIVSVGSLTKS